jgi:antitoxin HicB
MQQYSVSVIWSDADEDFVATSLEFPGASGFGVTWEDAVADVREAILGIIEVMEEDGEPIPDPRKLESYSGRLNLRMPRSMHRNLASAADREGVSLNTLMLTHLAAGLGTTAPVSGLCDRPKAAQIAN